jgi:Leucine-rich repeat (LRR) protein
MNKAKEFFFQVKNLIFSQNSIKHLKPFEYMAKYLPNVERLNFADNQIDDFTQLDYLAELGLAELVFLGNPIASHPNYRLYVLR